VERNLMPNTPARRRRLALLPFGLGAFFSTEGDAATPPLGERLIGPRGPSSPISPRALLRAAKPVLELLFKNPAFWGVTGTVGGAGCRRALQREHAGPAYTPTSTGSVNAALIGL
jgi:hypothetical protein